ncbi:MAG: UDP-N-acetylmuramate--L-alanine ligase, partial [Lachnospiraceae bacterium]|nr:UDP-N-acetylmuramate--L-alanine ligase [Lachnospiraceae bacterium]
LTEELSSKGCVISYPQSADNITDDTDVVVYTAAIHPDNPEYVRASELGITLITRAELLGIIMSKYSESVAIAGTHGKTTTTGMLSHVLMEAGKDPVISIGGILPSIGSNIRIGNGNTFVTEACEYTDSFLSLFPKYSIILNIEAEHLDYFKTYENVRASFAKFASQTGDTVVINGDEGVLIPSSDRLSVISYGLDPSYDVHPGDINCSEDGFPVFKAYKGDTELFEVKLSVRGMHNVSNALAVIAISKAMGISDEAIVKGLSSFAGTKRRFELKGKVNGFTVVDDYAHHPTEIKATLTAAKSYPANRIVCVFQPHTYSRTKAFLHDFADALSLADVVVLADIYAAREAFDDTISSKDIKDLLTEKGVEAYYFSDFSEIEKFLLKKCIDGDLLITMGAGNIVDIADHLTGS